MWCRNDRSRASSSLRYATAIAVGLCAVTRTAAAPPEGAELIGTAAAPWDTMEWLNSPPLALDQLRGKVVLIRWWTGPECPHCAASAPYLNAWHQKYRTQGLVVIGFYHHKSPTPLSPAHVKRLMDEYRLAFPVAIDPEWRTLKRWWLNGHDRTWTSVSFLIDQQGLIRHIHPGGSYSEADAKVLETTIQQLLTRGGGSS